MRTPASLHCRSVSREVKSLSTPPGPEYPHGPEYRKGDLVPSSTHRRRGLSHGEPVAGSSHTAVTIFDMATVPTRPDGPGYKQAEASMISVTVH